MEVILKKDVSGLGKEGQLIKVNDGHARNYLIPKNLAIEATDKNRRALEHEKRVTESHELKQRRDAEKLAEKIASLSCTIRVQAGDNDKLFGSVTVNDIAAAMEAEGVQIDRRKILLDEPIKELGVFTVPAKIHTDVTANIKVWVVKESQ